MCSRRQDGSAFALHTPLPVSLSSSSRCLLRTSPTLTAAPRAAPPTRDLAAAAVSAALSVAPLRRVVMAAGRRKVINDAARIGLDWPGDVALLRAALSDTLEPLRAALFDANVQLPEYYLAPFHAYENGNLGWQPALEAEISSQAVHARHSDDPLAGDATLRGNATQIIADRWGATSPRDVLDLGCSVGLSAALLKKRWPDARVVGVDASAEMLAVGAMRRPEVEYRHGLAEALPVEYEGAFDVVSVQLVVHELPDAPMRAMLREASRALRVGGMLVVMDVDPGAFAKVPPLFLALFQSTEPFFEEHKMRDVAREMEHAGFVDVEYGYNTRSHRTFTGFKR